MGESNLPAIGYDCLHVTKHFIEFIPVSFIKFRLRVEYIFSLGRPSVKLVSNLRRVAAS